MLDKTKVNIPERFKTHPLFNELVCGMNFGFMAKRGYYETEYARSQPALMRREGINWATLNANFVCEHFYSTRLFLDFKYSSGSGELVEMAKRLHDEGIRILFKPCMTPLDGVWMGRVDFPSDSDATQIDGVKIEFWKKWFESYNECMKYYSELAEKMGAEAMLVGAEYFGTELQSDYWLKTIENIRTYYSGPLSYEFDMKSYRVGHGNEWMNALDFLSFSYYPAARPMNREYVSPISNPGVKDLPDATLEDMLSYLEPQKQVIRDLCARYGNKPIAFTEIGTRSAHGTTVKPSDYRWPSRYDGEEQANYMEACFRTFWDIETWLGFFWWKWDETQIRPHYKTDPAGDQGFTIQGKPAAVVMRRWNAKKNG